MPSKNNSEFDLSFNLNLKPKFANIISKKFTIDQNTFLSGEFDTDDYNIKIQTPSLEFSKVIVDDFTLNISNNSGNINISTVKSNYFNGENIERLTFYDGFDGFPMFSTDGKYLVFASNRNQIKKGDTNLFICEWRN